jgi:hypothetical protein
VLACDFACTPDLDQSQTQYCTYAPAAGTFSLITITVSDGVIGRINFVVRGNTLLVGDLPLVWGRPLVQVYGSSVDLDWPGSGMSADAWARSRRFSYFAPVQRISLARLRS